MRHFLRHLCLTAAAAFALAGQVQAGNGIYLLQIGTGAPLEGEPLLDRPLLAELDISGEGALVEVVQMGNALTAEVHVQGTDCHVELHQIGTDQFASITQSGWRNDVVLSQGF